MSNSIKKFIYLQVVLIVISLGLVIYILAQIKPLTIEKDRLEKAIVVKADSIDMLNAEIKKLTDPTIIPMAHSRAVPGIFSYIDTNGDGVTEKLQNYDFTIWIKSSDLKLSKIKQVSYLLEESTINGKNKISDIFSNRFTVSYRGWGTLSEIKIKVDYNDGSSEIINFNMTEFLRTQNID